MRLKQFSLATYTIAESLLASATMTSDPIMKAERLSEAVNCFKQAINGSGDSIV